MMKVLMNKTWWGRCGWVSIHPRARSRGGSGGGSANPLTLPGIVERGGLEMLEALLVLILVKVVIDLFWWLRR
jgi:hypothetical protein